MERVSAAEAEYLRAWGVELGGVVSGKVVNDKALSGMTANGKALSGMTANGKALSGMTANGKALSGMTANGKALEVSRLVSLREEGLARLKGMRLEVPCCVVARSEAKGEVEVVKEGVGVLKEKVEGYSIYVLL